MSHRSSKNADFLGNRKSFEDNVLTQAQRIKQLIERFNNDKSWLKSLSVEDMLLQIREIEDVLASLKNNSLKGKIDSFVGFSQEVKLSVLQRQFKNLQTESIMVLAKYHNFKIPGNKKSSNNSTGILIISNEVLNEMSNMDLVKYSESLRTAFENLDALKFHIPTIKHIMKAIEENSDDSTIVRNQILLLHRKWKDLDIL